MSCISFSLNVYYFLCVFFSIQNLNLKKKKFKSNLSAQNYRGKNGSIVSIQYGGCLCEFLHIFFLMLFFDVV